MTPEQIDHSLDELTHRLERVRALYEQYFMGIERLEPTIPRKDVERRMNELRKTRFQNTAKRFKFQTLVQRYNSLQQYWNRTCRDIDNGTYRKHLRKAERRFGLEANALSDPKKAVEKQAEAAEKAADAKEKSEQHMADLLAMEADLEAELEKTLEELNSPRASSSTGSRSHADARGSKERKKDDDSVRVRRSIIISEPPSKRSASQSSSAEKKKPVAPAPAPLPKFDAPAPKIATRSGTEPGIRASPALSLPPLENKRAGRTGMTGGPPPAPSARPRAPQVSQGPPPAPSMRARAPEGSAKREFSPGPKVELSPAPKPLQKRPATGPEAAQTRSADERAALRQAAQKRSVEKKPTTTTSSEKLSEERIRALHRKYVDARKQTNATSVSLEKLSKSIRETEKKLREKNKGRGVDFEVAIKDGKAILKPKLR